MSFYVYILELSDNRFYVGYTQNLEARLKRHQSGRGGQTTKIWGAKTLLWSEKHQSRLSAMRRERQIKKWSRIKKLALIKGDRNKLKKTAKRIIKKISHEVPLT